MINFYEAIQLVGSVILIAGYLPQIKQIIRTKRVQDINVSTVLFVCFAILLMEIYAIHLVLIGQAFMFLVTNTMSFLSSAFLAGLVIYYKRRGYKNT